MDILQPSRLHTSTIATHIHRLLHHRTDMEELCHIHRIKLDPQLLPHIITDIIILRSLLLPRLCHTIVDFIQVTVLILPSIENHITRLH